MPTFASKQFTGEANNYRLVTKAEVDLKVSSISKFSNSLLFDGLSQKLIS